MTACDSAGRHQGSAYLWVLLTVALIGLSFTLVAEVHRTLTVRDKEAELLSIGRQYREALRRYHDRQVGGERQYPTSMDELLLDPRGPGLTRHLRQVFVDPMTGKAEWGLVRLNGRIVGIHSLSEARPVKRAGFDDDDLGFEQARSYRDWVFTHPSNLLMGNALAETPGAVPSSAGSGDRRLGR